MRPETTLFLLQSIDGKISFGESDVLDFDKHIPELAYSSIGLHSYYEEEKRTDDWTLCSGKTLAKVGWNYKVVNRVNGVTIVVIDNNYITEDGLINLSNGYGKVILVTSNYSRKDWEKSADVVFVEQSEDLTNVFNTLYDKYGCKMITIQAGGYLNCSLLRSGLIDNLNIIIAPMLVGGKDTSTAIDGVSLLYEEEIFRYIKEFQLMDVAKLDASYVQLRYKAFKK